MFGSIVSPIPWYRSIGFLIFLTSFTFIDALGTFNTNCSANERLGCRVEKDTCASNPRSNDYPLAPYDFRISPSLVTRPNSKVGSYELWVNFSWSPNGKSLNKTKGFELTVLDTDTNRNLCFTFLLENPIWVAKDSRVPVQFRFSTVDLLEYGHQYHVELQSLPRPMDQTSAVTNHITSIVAMPKHPDTILAEQLNQTGYFEFASYKEAAKDYCTPSSIRPGAHPQAFNWVGAFRIVYIHPKGRHIYVEFIAAPPQYCFEEYELILRDSNHGLAVQQTIITAEDLIHEYYDNVSVALGNHTFYNVVIGMYDITVVPVPYSRVDGRCVCLKPNRECGCHAARWSDVPMPEPPIPVQFDNPCDYLPPVKLPFDCPMSNATRIETVDDQNNNHGQSRVSNSTIMACLIVGALTALGVSVLVCVWICRRYRVKGIPRMYLLPLSHADTEMTINGSIGREMSTFVRPVKLTIVYARDSPEFERTVHDLVHYLNAQCYCNVKIDYSCVAEIAANKFDWAYKSILDADRVLLLNSYGAYMRYQAKLANTPATVERSDTSELDDLFLLQLDFLSQEYEKQSQRDGPTNKFVSIKFEFTPDDYVLPQANPNIRYDIPKHFRSLMIDLHQIPMIGDSLDDDASIPEQLRRVNCEDYHKCVEGERLRDSMEDMKRFLRDQSDWFERSHVRRIPKDIETPVQTVQWAENDRLLEPVAAAVEPMNQINQQQPTQQFEANENSTTSNNRTREYVSVDSGVGMSSTKRMENHSSPKRIGKPNGLIMDHENIDVRQHLIA